MKREVTLYDILEVSPHASEMVLKAAYRCLTQSNHPDKHSGNAGASARQAAINEAYFVLSDPAKRQRYDRALDLQKRIVERRVSDMPVHRRVGLAEGGQPGSRVFAFRPLS